ncbi:flagellar hook-associated protein FlgK [Thermodesulfatator indicus DSM 15286]|uniref:Flagellar hook-associated protein 1 n=1 Tax=Thermodesulfatator indicus (strain DSM 15286 / JCM 11887 / CIR29812) TaxID=667014 RepID=F8A868_THEID|nr:flagellar hook-associated protein FlgK [Thermodesulfatator indicus]AEH44340.1 flagellar hook-associated protein FlgK [Thermodesulfatator indicus DSM 15286]
MAGLYSALNIAKNSLLAFQMGVQVTGHNVANVDTEGYSRQKVVNVPYPPTPGPAGPMGSGVKVEQIKRYFDAFLEANLNLKRSDLGLLSAEETGLDLIQGLFNETNPLGLSKMLDDFFTSWQGLSNRAEGIPERRVVLEKGRVLAEAISDKYQNIVNLEQNVRLKLRDVVNEINELAKQIAEINRQITAAESGLHQANDLRDQRDKLVAKLSELTQVRYFENNQGAYAVILGNGYNLVDIDSYWQLEMAGGEVYWLGHSGEKVKLTSKEVSQGKLGGWLRIVEQISNDWNYEYVISTRNVFTPDGKLVKENTTWKELGLTGSVNITFRGTDHFGEEITGSYSTNDDTQTVRDFLNAIEKAYHYKVQAYLTEDGRLVVKDAVQDGGKLSFEITSGPLNFGRFDDEAANHRVEELNLTGKFQLFAKELIRAVNEIHTEGVGLKFYEGELEGTFQSDGTLKSLPFFQDIKGDGSLFVWVKSPNGKITPVKVDFALPSTATMDDVASQINDSLKGLGFDPDSSVKALVRGGRLVFQAKEGYGFAFSNDTAGILAATGLNTFFTGFDAGSIGLNEKLSVNPEYLAAARLDREAWRSENSLVGTYKSRLPIQNPDSIVFNDPPHKLYIRFFDNKGQQILHDTENGFKERELSIDISSGDTLRDIINKLDGIQGLRAYFDGDGRLVLQLDPNSSKNYAYFELGVEAPPPVDNFLAYLRDQGVWVPTYVSARGRQESETWFTDPENTTINEVANVSLNFVFYDAEGKETGRTSITIPNGKSLKDMVSLINATSELRAGFTEGDHGKLFISLENPPEGSVSFKMSVSGGDGDGELNLSDGTKLSLQNIADRQIFSGLEPFTHPGGYVVKLNGADPQNLIFSGQTTVRFFDAQGNELKSINFKTLGTSPNITDTNGNGQIDLDDLAAAFDASPELKAYVNNDELVVSLDSGAPAGTSYFVIEGNDPLHSWGRLTFLNTQGTTDQKDDSYQDLVFPVGIIENWLYDENGKPIDADQANETIDPFRLYLDASAGVVQILQKYNSEANAKFGLTSEFDSQGRLVVNTSGLYDTRSFVLDDAGISGLFDTTLQANRFDSNTGLYLFSTDFSVDKNATFPAQDITVDYLKPNGTSYHTETISFSNSFTLEDFLNNLTSLDYDSDGIADFSYEIDDSGRLFIRVNDPDLDNDGENDWVSFKLTSSLNTPEGNLTTYLARKNIIKTRTMTDDLQGFAPQPGDNRNALRLSALSDASREKLGEASISDYYTAIVGEVGIATKTVKNSKTFMEDLINQLKMMRDSISGVSLDEEMANLIKYQQAFSASAKILTVADEMLDTLIQSKR